MRLRLAILAAMLATASHAQQDQRADFALRSVDPRATHPSCIALWDRDFDSTLTMDGTNVQAWEDVVGGRVAEATNVSTRPGILPGGIWFGAGHKLVFSPAITATVSHSWMIVVDRPATNSPMNVLANKLSLQGSPFIDLNADGHFYSGQDTSKYMKFDRPGAGRMVLAGTFTRGGAMTNISVTVNGMVLPQLLSGVNSGQVAYDCMGYFYNRFSAGTINSIAVFNPPLSTEERDDIAAAVMRLKGIGQ